MREPLELLVDRLNTPIGELLPGGRSDVAIGAVAWIEDRCIEIAQIASALGSGGNASEE